MLYKSCKTISSFWLLPALQFYFKKHFLFSVMVLKRQFGEGGSYDSPLDSDSKSPPIKFQKWVHWILFSDALLPFVCLLIFGLLQWVITTADPSSLCLEMGGICYCYLQVYLVIDLQCFFCRVVNYVMKEVSLQDLAMQISAILEPALRKVVWFLLMFYTAWLCFLLTYGELHIAHCTL